MSDNIKNTTKKPIAIGGKPITIGGRATGKQARPSRPVKERVGAVEPALKDGLTPEERKRRLEILEKAGDVTDKLRRDAEAAELLGQERKADLEKRNADQVERENARVRREEEKKLAETSPAAVSSDPGVDIAELQSAELKQGLKPKVKERVDVNAAVKKTPSRKGEPERRQKTKFTVSDALTASDDNYEKSSGPSLAAVRRRREKEKMKAREALNSQEKIVRDVTVPETITVADLANRMAERTADVIKELMKLGIMATANQSIDADTAELVVEEFGHKLIRVSEGDVEDSLIVEVEDMADELEYRAPVVTIMGHVDHGKTSLLDALRSTDVAAGEAGGITQHIGAYSVTLQDGSQISFLDTPGHEAFTQMRQRGANVTDIVVLVVAADDGIMPQTIEAINHSLAAGVPIIVAVNKMDKPGADPTRVQTQMLEHGVQTEHFGGDILCIEVSAKERLNLDKLEEAILLQAEILQLKANPTATPRGAIVEAKLERGRGAVATVLIQKGTLKIGQIFVAGTQWGRVRALINDRGQNLKEAGPSLPVEILGWGGAPQAGDDFVVVENEAKAREVTEYRERKALAERSTLSASKGTVEDIFAQIKDGKIAELPLIIKADTQGSLEAIKGSLAKFDNEEVKTRVVHGGTGGITASDISFAKSIGGIIIGFNVRANPQARELAEKEGQEIRYYSIIYDLIDNVKGLLSGMLAPTVTEEHIGYAQIRQVFKVSKVGIIAGCYVTDGIVKRGAGVRILRDDVVIYEGSLKQLKREKDDAKEVKQSYECGMMFEKYDDIKENDVVECFEIKSEARSL